MNGHEQSSEYDPTIKSPLHRLASDIHYAHNHQRLQEAVEKYFCETADIPTDEMYERMNDACAELPFPSEPLFEEMPDTAKAMTRIFLYNQLIETLELKTSHAEIKGWLHDVYAAVTPTYDETHSIEKCNPEDIVSDEYCATSECPPRYVISILCDRVHAMYTLSATPENQTPEMQRYFLNTILHIQVCFERGLISSEVAEELIRILNTKYPELFLTS